MKLTFEDPSLRGVLMTQATMKAMLQTAIVQTLGDEALRYVPRI